MSGVTIGRAFGARCSMASDGGGSVTHWIGALQAGEMDEAARHLWGRYFKRLAHLARLRLRSKARGPGDEEDVALSVFRRPVSGKPPSKELPSLNWMI